MKNTNLILIGVAALVIGGAAGFVGGMQFQKMQSPQGLFANRLGGPEGGFVGRNGQGGKFGGLGGVRPVVGQIISADASSVTVKLPDGSSKIVLLDSKTMINKASQGSISDLTTGTNIAAFGTQNSDGSITAQNIQIGGMFRAGRGPTNQASSSSNTVNQ